MSRVFEVGASGQANGMNSGAITAQEVREGRDGGSLEIIGNADTTQHTAPSGCHYYALVAIGSDVVMDMTAVTGTIVHPRYLRFGSVLPALTIVANAPARMIACDKIKRTSGGELWAYIRRNDS